MHGQSLQDNKLLPAIASATLFQIGWFICVQGNTAWAVLASLVFFLLHGAYLIKRVSQWLFIASAALLGWLVDSALQQAGVIQFANSLAFSLGEAQLVFAPLWLLCVWLCFASTLLISFRWLYARLKLAAVLAFVSVPSTYYLGAKLSGSEFLLPTLQALVLEGLVWMLLFPVLLRSASLANAYRVHMQAGGWSLIEEKV